MTRTFKAFVAASVLALGASLTAQTTPDIPYDSVADLLKPALELPIGEVGGVGQNSKGDIFVYTRTGHPYGTLADNRTFMRNGSRLYIFDKTGKFVKEIGQDVYGFNAAIGLRVDAKDNVWVIDELSSQVIRFNPEGFVSLVLGRKPEAINVRPGPSPAAQLLAAQTAAAAAAAPPAGRGGAAPAAEAGRGGGEGRGGGAAAPPGSGTPGTGLNRPSDVAWDKAGNIYVADGMGNTNRVLKVGPDGKFVKQWGSTGSANGQFMGLKSIAIDAQDNVYVADYGNHRIQVFDTEGGYKRQFGVGNNVLTMCMTTGPTQYLYVSTSGDPDGMEDAVIYKVGLDGKTVGRFGSAGRQPKQFGLANSIDCRNENELLVGEMANWRVQKITLKAAAR